MKHTRWLIILLCLIGISICGVLFWALGDLGNYDKDAAAIASEIQRETLKVASDNSDINESISEGSTEPESGTKTETESETQPTPSTEPKTASLSLMFAGDVLLSNHVTAAYDKSGHIQGVVDQKLLDQIHQADIFMVNQEFPFSDRGEAAADKQFTFRLTPSRSKLLNEMDIDIVTLANNHALDFGRDALLDTCDTLDTAGIRYVGAGENMERAKQLVTMEAGGKTIGFLGASRVIPESGWTANSYTPGMLTTYDPAILLAEIRKAREICDYVVVYVHWGIERAETPEDYQRTLGKQYIDAGADLVIGSHPHVLQGFEYYKGKPIVYSLGNFVFGSSIPRTMLLKADIDETGIQLSMIPATSSGGYTRAVTEAGKMQEFYTYMESISYGVHVSDGRIVPDNAQP